MVMTEHIEQKDLQRMRAEYQRMETRLEQAKQRLAALLWVHGPMDITKNNKGILADLAVHERNTGGKTVLSAVLTSKRVLS